MAIHITNHDDDDIHCNGVLQEGHEFESHQWDSEFSVLGFSLLI